MPVDQLQVGDVLQLIDFRDDKSVIESLRMEPERVAMIGRRVTVRGFYNSSLSGYEDWVIQLNEGPQNKIWPPKWFVRGGLKQLVLRYKSG